MPRCLRGLNPVRNHRDTGTESPEPNPKLSFCEGARLALGRSVFLDGSFFGGGDVQSGNRHAAVVIKPNHDPTATGVNPCVVGARNSVTMAAARHDNERLERTGPHVLTHIRNHGVIIVRNSPQSCKFTKEREFAFNLFHDLG